MDKLVIGGIGVYMALSIAREGIYGGSVTRNRREAAYIAVFFATVLFLGMSAVYFRPLLLFWKTTSRAVAPPISAVLGAFIMGKSIFQLAVMHTVNHWMLIYATASALSRIVSGYPMVIVNMAVCWDLVDAILYLYYVVVILTGERQHWLWPKAISILWLALKIFAPIYTLWARTDISHISQVLAMGLVVLHFKSWFGLPKTKTNANESK